MGRLVELDAGLGCTLLERITSMRALKDLVKLVTYLLAILAAVASDSSSIRRWIGTSSRFDMRWPELLFGYHEWDEKWAICDECHVHFVALQCASFAS